MASVPARGRLAGAVWCCLLAAVLLGGAWASGILGAADRAIEDQRARLTPRPASGEVVVVAIDARSLDEVGIWPWPRELHAQIVRRLVEAGVYEIALDVDFSQPGPGAGDRELQAALAAAGGGVILPAFLQPASIVGGDVVLSRPIEPLRRTAWEGLVNVTVDPGGQLRGVRGGGVIEGDYLASMPELLAGVALPANRDLALDFSIDPSTVPRLSAADLMSGRVDPAVLSGRKVIVGATAVELGDNFAVPVHRVLSGPLVQALAVESLIQDRVMTHPATPAFFALGVVLAGCLAAAMFGTGFRWQLASGFAVAAVVEGVALALQAIWAVAVPTFALHLATAAFVLNAIVRELHRRQAFGLFAMLRSRNQERLLERIMLDSFDGVIVVGSDETVLRINPAAKRILHGNTGLKLEGRPLAETLPDSLANQVLAALRVIARDPARPFLGREICVTEGGAITQFIELVVTRSAVEGEADGAVFAITLRDVTERRTAELETEAVAKRAIGAARARATFIAALAHALRPPLDAVVDLAEALQAAPQEDCGPDAIGEHARRAAASAAALRSALQDIRDLSGISRGDGLELDVAEVDIAALFVEVAAVFPAAEDGVGRHVQFGTTEAGLAIAGDRRRLKGALVNAITFAIGVLPSGARLDVTAAHAPAGAAVSIAVTADRPLAVHREGSAADLGLAIVEEIVRAHGGAVAVGDGDAVISLTVPCRRERAVAEAA